MRSKNIGNRNNSITLNYERGLFYKKPSLAISAKTLQISYLCFRIPLCAHEKRFFVAKNPVAQ